MRDTIFYSACAGFLSGVLARSFAPVGAHAALLAGLMALGLLLYFIFVSKNRWGLAAAVFMLAVALGVLRLGAADRPAPATFQAMTTGKTTLTGMVADEPTIREDNIALDVRFSADGEETEALVTTGPGQDFRYGDTVTVNGKLGRPKNFTTDQGKEFDYVNYLRKDGIYYVMSYPEIETVARGGGNKVKAALFAAKEKFLDRMNAAIPAPENLLMGGLILGEKSSFSQALRQSFVNTGTIHIVALSGYNITIVAEWFMRLFAALPLAVAAGAGIFSVFLFVIMTGASSTAIRAGIMAALALVARMTGRTYDVGRALVLAAVVMIAINPLILAFDVSFQLSFLATIAVIYLTPRLEKYFRWVPRRWGLREVVTVTSAAYLLVLPFILYEMGNLSLVALPANVLVLPFIPFTMMLGFITGLAGLVWHVLALPFGFVSFIFLRYELLVIGFFSRLPFAALAIPDFPLLLTILIYAAFAYWLFRRNIALFFKAS